MSTLVIDYGMEGSFFGAINNAKSALSNRVEDYLNIRNRFNQIDSSSGNCSNAAYYLRKKCDQLQNKINKLNALKDRVDTFLDTAKKTDEKVAGRIKDDTKSFINRTGIGKTSKSIFESIGEFFGDAVSWVGDRISDAWEWAKEFYENNKYWIDIVVDVILVVAAVAACIGTGGLILAAGIFLVFDAACDLIYDGAAAYQYYVKGNEAEAERLSQKGGKDAFMLAGHGLDCLFGTDFIEGGFGLLYTGLSICAIGVSFYKSGKQILKDLKLDKIKIKSLFNGNKNKIKWGSHFNKENIFKAAKNYFGFKAVKQSSVMKLRYMKILGFKAGDAIVKTTENAKKLLQMKFLFKGTKKVFKTIGSFYGDITSGDFNPFNKTTNAITDFYSQSKLISSGGVN